MSTTGRTRWMRTLLAGVVILSASAIPLAGQATDTSAKRIKIQKAEPGKRVAGGEVCMPMKCMMNHGEVDSAVAAERAAALVREQSAREAQKTLDSMAADVRVRDVIARMENAAVAVRERARLDSIARVEAAEREAQLAMKRHLARGFRSDPALRGPRVRPSFVRLLGGRAPGLEGRAPRLARGHATARGSPEQPYSHGRNLFCLSRFGKLPSVLHEQKSLARDGPLLVDRQRRIGERRVIRGLRQQREVR